MAKKKVTQISVSQEENVQAQHLLEQYHEIANHLHESNDQAQTETVLAEINAMPEGAQIALLKGLSRQQHVDAADVVAALHELSPLKSVRKEAKRSLIQLEGARVYPQWQLPREQTPESPVNGVIQPATANPPRFWRGLVSDTEAIGQIQLLLFWEQGEDYDEIRIMGFYLDLQNAGVKDFFTAIDSKRNVEKFIVKMKTKMSDVGMKDCTLVEGRRLLLFALKVHALDGSKPPFEYRSHIPLINQLVMESPTTVVNLDELIGDAGEESLDLHGLNPKNVVINFIEFWIHEDYGLAYDLLASDSPLRDGLSRDEWVERRQTWANEAVPDALEPSFLYERDQPKSIIWLPSLWSANYAETHKEVVAGWSIELNDLPEGNTLSELPEATLVYAQTQRHWFWTSYILIRDDGEWRIQRMTDEGKNAQLLSIEELQEKTQEFDDQLKEVAAQLASEDILDLNDEETLEDLGQLIMRIMEASSYGDVLVKKLPLDRSLYVDAAARMAAITQYERCLAYLIPLIQRFPEQRTLYLRRMADAQLKLSRHYFNKENDERGELYQELAAKSLRDSLAIENNFETHLSLVELLMEDMEDDERLEEAKDHLLQARELITDPDDVAHVEQHLAEIATEREEYAQALSHYQRVLELEPDSADAWFDVGEAHEALDHFAEAEISYKRALELEPDDIGYYYTLSELYSKNNDPVSAMATIEQGIAANPDSVPLHVYLTAMHVERGDYQQAEKALSKAEELDPKSELVVQYRQMINFNKRKQAHVTSRLKQPLKLKKKRR